MARWTWPDRRPPALWSWCTAAAVLGDFGSDCGQLQHLVAQRLRVVALKHVLAATALCGLEDLGVIGREQGPLLSLVPGLALSGCLGLAHQPCQLPVRRLVPVESHLQGGVGRRRSGAWNARGR
jgi:hypothetical protein